MRFQNQPNANMHQRCAQPPDHSTIDDRLTIRTKLTFFMKRTIIIFNLIFITTQLTIAQIFVVSESKKCYSSDNKKIKKGDTLYMNSVFSIEKNGKLMIRHPNQWYSAYSTPSKYRLDTLFAKLMTNREYMTHDSIFNILKEKNIYKCDFPYKLICKPIFGGYATSYADNIKQDTNFRIETTEPLIKIGWNYPIEYKGSYYILVTNMFEDYIDIKMTKDNFIDLNLIPYKRQGAILYKVISEECRESDTNVIIMK
jgi:hypothetical protein